MNYVEICVLKIYNKNDNLIIIKSEVLGNNETGNRKESKKKGMIKLWQQLLEEKN